MKSNIINQDIKGIVKEFKSELMSLEGKTILITGGNGFLGGYLVDTFVEANKELKKPSKIIVLNRNKINEGSRLSHLVKDPNVKFLTQDIGKPFKLPSNINIIIHAASTASPQTFLNKPLETIDSNVLGIRTLLEYAKNNPIENFLFFSSSEVYGNPSQEFIPTPEAYSGNVDCVSPRACYSESKRFGETLCSTFFRTSGVPTKILRIGHTYGPGLREDKAIQEFFGKSINDKEINLRDSGESTMSYCYISDAIKGMLNVMFKGKSGEPYNIGSGFPRTSIKALVRLIAKTNGNGTLVSTGVKPNDNSKEYIRELDISKLKGLGYESKVSIEQGLSRLKNHIEEVGL